MKILLLPAALICLALSGCGAGQVISKTARVISDPSIQVGDGRDQVTAVSLSLYATPTVNPNPDSLAVMPEETAEPAVSDMYQVNLASHSQQELLKNLRSLVAYVEADTASSLASAADQGPAQAQGRSALGDVGDTPWARTCPAPPTAASRNGSQGTWPVLTRGVGEYAAMSPSEPAPVAQAPAEPAATPISFKVIELKDDSLFLGADYDALEKDLKKALGTTYLAHEDYVLRPGQFKFINAHTLSKGTRYVAVLAAYHDIDGTSWKQVLRVEPVGRTYALMLRFGHAGVSLQDEN
jgi:type VI secretion system protein VasD